MFASIRNALFVLSGMVAILGGVAAVPTPRDLQVRQSASAAPYFVAYVDSWSSGPPDVSELTVRTRLWATRLPADARNIRDSIRSSCRFGILPLRMIRPLIGTLRTLALWETCQCDLSKGGHVDLATAAHPSVVQCGWCEVNGVCLCEIDLGSVELGS
jgi:hypothetical protein